MSDEALGGIVSMIIVLGIISYVGYIVGEKNGTEDMELRAVEAGHAEYYIGTNHFREWRWKECK